MNMHRILHLLLVAPVKQPYPSKFTSLIKTSFNENIFQLTGPLWGDSTGDQWIPLTKGQ